MIRMPSKPRGITRWDIKEREIIEALEKMVVVDGKGIKVTHTTRGTVVDSKASSDQGGGGGSTVPRWG